MQALFYFLLEFFNELKKHICDAGVYCYSFTLDSLFVAMRVLIGKFGSICMLNIKVRFGQYHVTLSELNGFIV